MMLPHRMGLPPGLGKGRIDDGKEASQTGEIAYLLRQADVLHGQGMSMADTIRQLGISEVTSYRWRKKYGGTSGDQPYRLCGA